MKAFTFDDVLLVPQFNRIRSRKDVNLSITDTTGKLSLALPVLSANMDTVTGADMAKFMRSQGGMGVLHRFMNIEQNVKEYESFRDCVVSVGTTKVEIERFLALREAGADKYCVDVAHGHSEATGEMVSFIRKMLPGALIIAGNVCTLDGAEYLANSGADIIKVGIGPSPVCRTRGATGFGYPQLGAIQNCSAVDRSIIADGGLKSPGDIVKALAFGADFVMLGSMLAGTHVTPGKETWDGPKLFKTYRGMASREANEEFYGSLPDWKTSEGVQVKIPYRNENETLKIIQDISGGMRSGLTYCGAENISELQFSMKYVEISPSTVRENKTFLDV